MHGFMEGLHITAPGMGVVFVGFVLLVIAATIWGLTLSRRKTRARRYEREPAPLREGTEEETVAAVAACLACIIAERRKDRARIAGVPADLVAAILAAIAAREERTGACPATGPVRVHV